MICHTAYLTPASDRARIIPPPAATIQNRLRRIRGPIITPWEGAPLNRPKKVPQRRSVEGRELYYGIVLPGDFVRGGKKNPGTEPGL